MCYAKRRPKGAGAELPSRQDLPAKELSKQLSQDDELSAGLKDSDRPFMQ